MFYHRSTSSYYVECPKNLGYVEVDYLLSNITIKNISGFIINKFAIKQKSSYPRAFQPVAKVYLLIKKGRLFS